MSLFLEDSRFAFLMDKILEIKEKSAILKQSNAIFEELCFDISSFPWDFTDKILGIREELTILKQKWILISNAILEKVRYFRYWVFFLEILVSARVFTFTRFLELGKNQSFWNKKRISISNVILEELRFDIDSFPWRFHNGQDPWELRKN